MNELAINSERGKQASLDQRYALEWIRFRHQDWSYSISPQDGAGFVDGDFCYVDSREKHRAFECKCRYNMDEAKFWGEYRGLWMITFDKLQWLCKMSVGFGIPGYGILYIVPSSALLIQKITDKDGNFVLDFEIKQTWSKATCNGGEALRDNAFIPMRGAQEFRVDEEERKIFLALEKLVCEQ